MADQSQHRVLARKYRPQTFEDVLGQQAVTRTLLNALKHHRKRLAHSFVFAGPRGCGKTTSARILARALNCIGTADEPLTAPTTLPCGQCAPCLEIAAGRDMDMLEIDAATHTGVDNVREVIIEGLSIAPVRNRYKVFLIDEVHMLSASSFNALLKSIEEPPPHVVFMMATTELHKIPDTVLSRSQIYEFRTIPARTVADRLRHIATAESIAINDDALMMLARAGEGSMRDSLSAFDQVLAFAGEQVTTDDVAAVLGLIARDLVIDMLEAVVAEDAPAAFTLTESAISRGYDLRLLCRELSRAMRDLLILSVDPGRASDPDIAGEAERDRLVALVAQWSREDLLRGFDLLTRAEQEIRQSEQPRFSMEMALLRLMHLRKLVPLTELLAGGRLPQSMPRATASGAAPAAGPASGTSRAMPPRPSAPAPRPVPSSAAPSSPTQAAGPTASHGTEQYRDALLADIKAAKPIFYNLVVAQAFRIEATAEGVTFTFQPNQKVPRQQAEDNRGWVQELVERLTGRRLPVTVVVAESAGAAGPAASAPSAVAPVGTAKAAASASTGGSVTSPLEHETVKSILEMFPVEKTRIDAGS